MAMDQFSSRDNAGSLYRRRRSMRLFGFRLGPPRQVLYTSLSLLFSLFVNYVFLWPVNHFWALMLLALAVSGVMLNDMRRRWAVMGAACSFAVAGLLYLLVGPAVSSQAGAGKWLLPAAATTTPNACSGKVAGKMPADLKLALVGDTAILLHPGQNTLLLTVGTCKSLSLFQNADDVFLNVDDYDDYGTLIFRISNNQLHLVDGKAVYEERALDRSTTGIFAEDGDELLRVSYLNPQTIRLSGVFACKGHDPVRIANGAPIQGAPPASCLDGSGVEVK